MSAQDGRATVIMEPVAVERLIARNRRLRRLLLDIHGFLVRPGPQERQLERRARLAERIREECEE